MKFKLPHENLDVAFFSRWFQIHRHVMGKNHDSARDLVTPFPSEILPKKILADFAVGNTNELPRCCIMHNTKKPKK
jgi:hypothetical protein